jgi:hypothetical protein
LLTLCGQLIYFATGVALWSCSTSRARTGFTKPIAKEKKKEFAFIKAKAVVPRFCST